MCLADADCGTDLQCDIKNTTNYYTCNGGYDTPTAYGRCIPKPAAPTGTPQERCSACLTTVRPLVDRAVANASLKGSDLGKAFYDVCSTKGYALAACSRVSAAIESSYSGNLARRAGALCIRLAECSATGDYTVSVNSSTPAVTTAVTPTPTVNTTTNTTNSSTAVTASTPTSNMRAGSPDACTVEGVIGGALVAGTFSATGEMQVGTLWHVDICPYWIGLSSHLDSGNAVAASVMHTTGIWASLSLGQLGSNSCDCELEHWPTESDAY